MQSKAKQVSECLHLEQATRVELNFQAVSFDRMERDRGGEEEVTCIFYLLLLLLIRCVAHICVGGYRPAVVC